MFDIRNPYRQYLRRHHPTRIHTRMVLIVFGLLLVKWTVFLTQLESDTALVLAYCSGIEVFLIPLLPFITSAAVASYVASERKTDFFEGMLLTTLGGKQIVWAFVRNLALPYFLLATLIEIDVWIFMAWLLIQLIQSLAYTTTTTTDWLEVLSVFGILMLMFFPVARGIQAFSFLVGLNCGLRFPRPLYAIVASIGFSLMFSCGALFTWGLFSSALSEAEGLGTAIFIFLIFNLLIWGMSFPLLRYSYRAVRLE